MFGSKLLAPVIQATNATGRAHCPQIVFLLTLPAARTREEPERRDPPARAAAEHVAWPARA
jgi:hypothetical protein